MDLTLLLSLWGAILSTALATLKILDYWNNRFRIQVSPVLRGCREEGHDINITNLSSKPVLLEYMEVYTKKEGQEKCVWSPEDILLNARIESFDTKVYNFSEFDYFPWTRGISVHVRLCFAGQKPIIKDIV